MYTCTNEKNQKDFNKKLDSGESLLSGEIQSTGTMKEGTVPVPLTGQNVWDSDVVPVQELLHPGGATAAGEKLP